MVPLKWGTVISTLLPGALALFAIAPFFPPLDARLHNIEQISTAMAFVLLGAAALAGGVLNALTRVVWERYWLVPHCHPPDALSQLRAENLELYERGVESSYKFVLFYCNFAWATVLLIFGRLRTGDKPCSAVIWLLAITALILLRASHVQWTYYVNYLKKVFPERRDDARQRPTSGDTGSIHKGSSEGEYEEYRQT